MKHRNIGKFGKIFLWNLLVWIGLFTLAVMRNSGNYNGNLAKASLYFILMCSPVFYLMRWLIRQGMSDQPATARIYAGWAVLYLFSIPYAFLFVYRIFPSVAIFLFNPEGQFTRLQFIGTVSTQFILLAAIAFLFILIQKYAQMLIDFVRFRMEQKKAKARGAQYQMNAHLEGILLSFVANVEADQGNWDNYELICKVNEIKSYARRVHYEGEAMVSLQEEWAMLLIMTDIIHIVEGRSDLLQAELEGDWEEQLVPAFTLLTLIENIAQYARFDHPDTVGIRLKLYPGGFEYQSYNEVNAKRKPVFGSSSERGKGLALLQERLELALLDKYQFEAGRQGTQYRVHLKIDYGAQTQSA